MSERRDSGLPYDPAPMCIGRFGQPESCHDLINRYGTYNIQPTNESENLFPLIAQGLPRARRGLRIDKPALEQIAE